MLWEKRKFITETQYCITVGNIDEGFYPDIVACEPQWAEWKELFHIDEDQTDLFTSGKSKEDRRIAFLKANPTLVLDTKHFDADFVGKLLAMYDDVDGMTDGLLVYGENFQALNLLMGNYRNKVRTVYIDPPYNTSASEILYKNDYKHSSWLSLVSNRLSLTRPMLEKDGVVCVAIDDAEYHRLRDTLGHVYGEKAVLGTVIVRSNPAGRSALTLFGGS
jgi:adenine-specific DNA-methyltransferase